MFAFEHQVESDGDGRSLTASVCLAGVDIVITVGGGARPHIGTVVLAQPHPSSPVPTERFSVSSSVLTIPPHKEEAIARPIAEAVCRTTGRVTVVTAGVHDDDLDRSGIESYLRLTQQMATELADRLGAQTPGGST